MPLAKHISQPSQSPESSRAADFSCIIDSLRDSTAYAGKNALVAEGDSLVLLRKIPDRSVSLVLTDPPYHSTKKRNIFGDTAFNHDDDYVSWVEKYAVEWKRILKPNGSLYVFCATEMAARLEVMLSKPFNILAHVVWTKPNEPGFDGWKQKMNKEALRQWYSHSERLLFVEPAYEGNLYRSYFANFLRTMREQAGISQYVLTGMI